MGKPEGIVEKYLAKQAKSHGFLCWKFESSSQNGVPDRVLIGHGRNIYVETKSPVGKLRDQQEIIIDIMRKHGAEVYVINTKELVDKFFEKLRKDLKL